MRPSLPAPCSFWGSTRATRKGQARFHPPCFAVQRAFPAFCAVLGVLASLESTMRSPTNHRQVSRPSRVRVRIIAVRVRIAVRLRVVSSSRHVGDRR